MPSSLTRFLSRALVSLYPPTCVGLRYGPRPDPQGLFSPARGRRLGVGSPLRLVAGPASRAADFPAARPAPARETVHPSPRHPRWDPRRSNSGRRLRNVHLMSIACALRPRLRHRLTPGGRTCPGKPWDSGGRDFHPPFRYSCPHNRWRALRRRSRARLLRCAPRSPTGPLARAPPIRRAA